MKSNYKRIGDFIRLVDERNLGRKVTTLLGLSIDKVFIPSVANIVGADMENYKIIRKGQFACSLMQVRRDKKLPVALLTEIDEAIISQAYPVFEIVDQKELLPEYLMMWMTRSEFDRHACFLAVGGVRGSLEWADFCDMELPVPVPEEQREVVREYHVIVNQIRLNEEISTRLEETARAVYKQWFVDFEFPISAEYASIISKPSLAGKPYKSSGGKITFLEELGAAIPYGWMKTTLDKALIFKNGKTRPASTGNVPVYGGNGVMGYANSYNNEDIIVIGRVGAYGGSLFRVFGKCWVSDNAISALPKINHITYCFYLLKSLRLNNKCEGTGQPLLTQAILNAITIILPQDEVIKHFDEVARRTLFYWHLKTKENKLLHALKETILSKMSITDNTSTIGRLL
jgi:type I restriction enzyme S subunit